MWPNPQENANLVTFTKEILNGKLHFLCSVIQPLSPVNISIFHEKLVTFAASRNKDKNCIVLHNVCKVVLIKVIVILMISPKLATPYLLKIKFFKKKGMRSQFLSMTSKKTVSRDSNYIAVVIRSKLGKAKISVSKVIIASLLYWFDKKKIFFWRLV